MRLIDGDYLYNKLVANKCPYDLVLQMVKEEPTVCDIDAIRAEIENLKVHGIDDVSISNNYAIDEVLQIIDKHTKGDNG